jgi:predicted transcriptional regulator
MNTNRKSIREVHTTVRITADVHKRLREIAAREDRSVSAEVRRLIHQHIADAEREAA